MVLFPANLVGETLPGRPASSGSVRFAEWRSSIQTHEVFERREPVLLVVNEASDGLWQLIGSTDADSSTGRIGHLCHAIDNDPTMLDILDLSPGHSAIRADIGEPWTRYPADVA